MVPAGSLAGTRMHVLYTTLHVSRFLSDGRIYAFGEENQHHLHGVHSNSGSSRLMSLTLAVCCLWARQFIVLPTGADTDMIITLIPRCFSHPCVISLSSELVSNLTR